MSNVDIGASGAPAPAAPPPAATRQIPIDTGAPPGPSPISGQTPPAREGSRGEPPKPADKASRRDSIRQALDKAGAKPSEAKARSEGSAEIPKLDLRKRPADQEDQKPARERGEHGHFAPQQRQQEGAANRGLGLGAQTQPSNPTQKYDPQANPLAPQAAYREPPQRMAEHAKLAWHEAPESVRGEVYRMHREFGQAYQQHEKLRQAVTPLLPYARMAHQQGTTVAEALRNYTGIESRLRADPIGGLDQIVYNLNLRTPDGRRLTFRDVAHYVASQSPEQVHLSQTANQQTAMQNTLAQIARQQQALAQQQQQMQYRQEFRQLRRRVDRFAETHPRLDELGPAIERELKHGYGLKTAYARACLLNPGSPATHAAQTRPTQIARPAQTRTPDRSISGSPSRGGGSSTAQRPEKQVSRREALASAIRRANGSL